MRSGGPFEDSAGQSAGSSDAHPKGDNHQAIDLILKSRFHGAANIRGIRFQLLYSVLEAFSLYREGEPKSIRLEGVEDLDLLGWRCDNLYVQAKSSVNVWTLSRLSDVLKNFLDVNRAEPECRFRLVLEGPVGSDIRRFMGRSGLPVKERIRAQKQVAGILQRIGGQPQEIAGLLERIEVVSLSEDEVWSTLRQAVADSFHLGTDAVEVYILSLLGRFLDWASGRREVGRGDLDRIRVEIGEALSSESQYQAVGHGYIQRLDWHTDSSSQDFFDGKATRPGHIAAGVDVRRLRWLERIDRALEKTSICVLRAPSGQGKSALLYRYAFEEGPPQDTYVVRVAETQEQAEGIRQYLRFRAKLGPPILILIDNADWRTRLWPQIAQECAALALKVLVSVRVEDWYRFAQESLATFEILEPVIDRDEAVEIFNSFQAHGRIHDSVDSPHYAWERVGEPRLLLEYVYFLTHGRMLIDRLREQVRTFSREHEDPAKSQLLRMVTLAAVLGTPLLTQRLIAHIRWRDDPQNALTSLAGEYLTVSEALTGGMHWVRSGHLAELMHANYSNPASTALACLNAVPPAGLATFVANALVFPGLDFNTFWSGLVEWLSDPSIETLLAALAGVFEAGERKYFEENRQLFEECKLTVGTSGIFFLVAETMPIIHTHLAEEMANLLGERGQAFERLRELRTRATKSSRGLDLCRRLFEALGHGISLAVGSSAYGTNGEILDWCALCGVRLRCWPAKKCELLSASDWQKAPLPDLCRWAQGLFRYDPHAYKEWFDRWNGHYRSYLRLHTESMLVEVEDGEVRTEFLLRGGRPYNEAMRLHILRSALPFGSLYRSNGIWILPFGWKPSFDETEKAIPTENLPFESDITKNVVWRNAVENYYRPDSYYRYLEAWWEFRTAGVAFALAVTQWLDGLLSGRIRNPSDLNAHFRVLAGLDPELPHPPQQTPEDIVEALKVASGWAASYRNFYLQLAEYFGLHGEERQRVGRLLVHNFLEAVAQLHDLQVAFDTLLKVVPDYFDFAELKKQEIAAYGALDERLYAWICDPPSFKMRDAGAYTRRKRNAEEAARLAALRNALAGLRRDAVEITLPARLATIGNLRYSAIVFSISRLSDLDAALGGILNSLSRAGDVADFFFLIPTYRERRIAEDAIRVSANNLAELREGRSLPPEAIIPLPLPRELADLLPSLPMDVSPERNLATQVLGVRGSLDYIANIRSRLKDLAASPYEFDVQLMNELEREVGIIARSAAAVATEALQILRSRFSSRSGDSAYELVTSFLSSSARYLEHGSSEEESIPDGLLSEQLSAAVWRLLPAVDGHN